MSSLQCSDICFSTSLVEKNTLQLLLNLRKKLKSNEVSLLSKVMKKEHYCEYTTLFYR